METINKIKFSSREIDIISCISSGRKTKIIASLLCISPKTVESNIYNIMAKLGCNSRETIVDFIEKSGVFDIIKRHYISLRIENIYKQRICYIKSLVIKKGISCIIIYNNENVCFSKKLKSELEYAGIHIKYFLSYNEINNGHINHDLIYKNSDIFIFIDTYLEFLNPYMQIRRISKKTIYISRKENLSLEDPSHYFTNIINFTENCYILLFLMLQDILDDDCIKKIISDFIQDCNLFDDVTWFCRICENRVCLQSSN